MDWAGNFAKFADESRLGKVERMWGRTSKSCRDPRGASEMQVIFNTGKHKVISTTEQTKPASYLKCCADHHCWRVKPLALTLCIAALAPQQWKGKSRLGRRQRLRGCQCTSGTLHAVLVSSFPKGCRTREKDSEEEKEITRCGAASLTNVQVRNSSWELEKQLKDVRPHEGLENRLPVLWLLQHLSKAQWGAAFTWDVADHVVYMVEGGVVVECY